MIGIICISTFNQIDKLKGITLEKKYEAKWSLNGEFLIKNDVGEFLFYPVLNFIRY